MTSAMMREFIETTYNCSYLEAAPMLTIHCRYQVSRHTACAKNVVQKSPKEMLYTITIGEYHAETFAAVL